MREVHLTWAVAAAAIILLAGCASTAQRNGTQIAATDRGPLAGVDGSAGTTGTAATGSANGSTASRVGRATTGTGRAGTATPGSGTLSTGGSPTGDGATAAGDALKVGVMWSSDANTVIGSTGSAMKVPDARDMYKAVIDYVNKSGGIGGHPVEPAFYDAQMTRSSVEVSQGACTQWTQDDHVFAALPSATFQDNDALRTCMANAGVLTVYAGVYSTTKESDFASSPLWFEPDTLSLERFATVFAAGLQQQGFFQGTKIRSSPTSRGTS